MSDDPLTLALQPRADETLEERQRRMSEEREAKRVSDEIDAQLKLEQKAVTKRKKETVRVLLLGQSESGKSTTLKNFQMRWAPQSWIEEKASWRTVVLLNIAKSALYMISVLLAQPSGESISFGELHIDLDALYDTLANVETLLRKRICAGTGSEECGDYRTGPGALHNQSRELYMPSNTTWKDRFLKIPRKSFASGRPSTAETYNARVSSNEKDEAMEVLISRKRDIQHLWKSSIVQELLRRRGVRLEDTPGFFMEDLDRILRPSYTPSDDDVVRARLRTMGIQEHKFVFEAGNEVGREWTIYDVGGSRPQRGESLSPEAPAPSYRYPQAAWFSFFEDVHAVVFLVPVNCFDEVLEEDHGVNRLQDSINLWKELCCSPLLAKSQLILFLNKVDLLKKKLESGVPFAHFVPAYADRMNDVNSVCRYLRTQFKEVQTRYSPVDRTFNAWLTCATDIKATEKTLATVRYGIVRERFKDANLI